MAGDEAGVTLGQPHLSRQDLGSLVRDGTGPLGGLPAARDRPGAALVSVSAAAAARWPPPQGARASPLAAGVRLRLLGPFFARFPPVFALGPAGAAGCAPHAVPGSRPPRCALPPAGRPRPGSRARGDSAAGAAGGRKPL